MRSPSRAKAAVVAVLVSSLMLLASPVPSEAALVIRNYITGSMTAQRAFSVYDNTGGTVTNVDTAAEWNATGTTSNCVTGNTGALVLTTTLLGGLVCSLGPVFGQPLTGTWTSAVIDGGAAGDQVWGTTEATVVRPPSTRTGACNGGLQSTYNDSGFKYQIATSVNTNGPFTFVGPDGTASTYFDGAETPLANAADGARYAQIKVTLSTAALPSSPQVTSLILRANIPILSRASGAVASQSTSSAAGPVVMGGARGSPLDQWTATQSSTYGSTLYSTAAKAVDGNTDGCYYDQSVQSTDQINPQSWQVDLLQNRSIGVVRLWPRTDCCSERIGTMTMYVSSTALPPFGTTPTLATNPDLSIITVATVSTSQVLPVDTPVNRFGEYIRLTLNVASPLLINIAEFGISAQPYLAKVKPVGTIVPALTLSATGTAPAGTGTLCLGSQTAVQSSAGAYQTTTGTSQTLGTGLWVTGGETTLSVQQYNLTNKVTSPVITFPTSVNWTA